MRLMSRFQTLRGIPCNGIIAVNKEHGTEVTAHPVVNGGNHIKFLQAAEVAVTVPVSQYGADGIEVYSRYLQQFIRARKVYVERMITQLLQVVIRLFQRRGVLIRILIQRQQLCLHTVTTVQRGCDKGESGKKQATR